MDVVSAKVYKNAQFQGSIRCMSNVFESTNSKKFIEKLNDINLEMFKLLISHGLKIKIAKQ
jgi:hypothetical protein